MSVGSRTTSALLPTPEGVAMAGGLSQESARAKAVQISQPHPAVHPGSPEVGGCSVAARERGAATLHLNYRLSLSDDGGKEQQNRGKDGLPRQSGLADRAGHGRRALALESAASDAATGVRTVSTVKRAKRMLKRIG